MKKAFDWYGKVLEHDETEGDETEWGKVVDHYITSPSLVIHGSLYH